MQEKNNTSEDRPIFEHRFEDLQERASKDALSGLLNRVTAEQYIRQRLQSMEENETCALFIIDLDDFKKINDTLGHMAGDRAIHRSAQILSSQFRAKDIVGRLGGDEFIVFLSGQITESAAKNKGRRLCESLQVVVGINPAVGLTASIGICFAAGKSHTFASLYQKADAALYEAKKKGKHCFCLYSDQNVSDETFTPVNAIPLSGLLEYMDSGVCLLEIGEQPRLLYVSPSFFRIIGADPLQYTLPLNLSNWIHPDDWISLKAVYQSGVESGNVVEHTHRVSLNGRDWTWWHIRAVKIDYDNPLPVMLVTNTDITRFKEQEQRLQEINERLRVAFEQTSQILWEVDIASQTAQFFGEESSFRIPREERTGFPESLISSGWIHPDSASRFREFARDLLEGKVHGYANFIVQSPDTGRYAWAVLSYRMLFDDAGYPARAVGIIENLPHNFIGEKEKSILKRPLPSALISDLILAMRANLSQDSIKELWMDGADLSDRIQTKACSHFLFQEETRLFFWDSDENLADFFNRERLLQRYSAGERWLSAEYRRISDGKNTTWVYLAANLTEDPLTEEIYLFVYIIRLDRRRRWEQNLKCDIDRDPVTRLYSRDTARLLSESLITENQAGMCAMALIELSGLARLYADDTKGLGQKRYYIATALSVSLGTSCIISQYSNDKFLIFFPDACSKFDIRKRIEDSFAFLRLVLNDDDLNALRFVASVSCDIIHNINYDIMLDQVIRTCGFWENTASDLVVFSQEDNDSGWAQIQSDALGDQIRTHTEEMKRPLSEGEKDVIFHCLSAMLTSDSLEISVRSVLSYIGIYYQADRVYLLSLAENRHVVTMLYEWTDPKKPSIQQAVSGMRVERFPLLKRCMEERSPVFLKRTHDVRDIGSDSIPDSVPDIEHPWYFTVFPLMTDGVIRGFLCVENSRRHSADAALFSTLIPYLLREQQRFRAKPALPGALPQNLLTEFPNLRSYQSVIGSLNSDTYHSMGAVCLDIPDLSAINSSLGFEYGSKLLWYVSKTLSDIFGNSLLFRTWDAEFVALCPNTTRQVFTGRCIRLSTTIQRRYPKYPRIGYTWADGTFDGQSLVNEARAILRSKMSEADATCEKTSVCRHPRYRSVMEAINDGRFTVYFQPKVNMITGEAFGAEVLVRGIDEGGKIIAPNRFINDLEKSGSIRDLDLYVLNHTLFLMNQWKEQGIAPIPVSVNFSRITLFNTTTLASILAIQSRYPGLPADLLELEITESAGNMEKTTLTNIMEQFRQHGITFSLDDFGSEYANIPIFTNVRFDAVKLDRRMIADLADNSISQMLIRDIVHICETCGMDCVAEGVETSAQKAALLEAGCTRAQGYYYDPPLPAEEFKEKYLSGTSPE